MPIRCSSDKFINKLEKTSRVCWHRNWINILNRRQCSNSTLVLVLIFFPHHKSFEWELIQLKVCLLNLLFINIDLIYLFSFRVKNKKSTAQRNAVHMLILWSFPLSLPVDMAFESRSMFDDVMCDAQLYKCTHFKSKVHWFNAVHQMQAIPHLHLGGHISTLVCGVSFIFTLPSIIWVFIFRRLSLRSVVVGHRKLFTIINIIVVVAAIVVAVVFVAIKTLPSIATVPVRPAFSLLRYQITCG